MTKSCSIPASSPSPNVPLPWRRQPFRLRVSASARLTGICSILAASLLASGCAGLRGVSVSVDRLESKTPQDLIDKVILSPTMDSRNQWVDYNLIRINDAYYKFEEMLQAERNYASTSTAVANLMFDIASSLTSSAGVKANYTAATALTSGSLAIVNRQTFLEQTVTSLVAAMRANRAKIYTAIRIGMTKDIGEYRLPDAHRDLLEYLRAGSLIEGMTFVADVTKAEAKQDIDKAEKELQEAVAYNEKERQLAYCISISLQELDAKRAGDLIRVYQQLDPNAPTDADLPTLVNAMSRSMTNAPAARVREIFDALDAANLIKQPCEEY